MAYTHTVQYGGKSYDVATATHRDDHNSLEDWLRANKATIETAIGLANIGVNVALLHKPPRRY